MKTVGVKLIKISLHNRGIFIFDSFLFIWVLPLYFCCLAKHVKRCHHLIPSHILCFRTLTAEQSPHKHTNVKLSLSSTEFVQHFIEHGDGDDSQDLVGMETPVTPGNRYSVFHIVVEGDVNKSIGPTFSEILAFSVFINMFFSLLRSVIAAICYWSLQSWGSVN